MDNAAQQDRHELAFTSPTLVASVYRRSSERLGQVRAVLDRPLTLPEKVLYGHLKRFDGPLQPGSDYGGFTPDRLAMPDSSAQMALLQLMSTGNQRSAVPGTVHCDHLISAVEGVEPDLSAALAESGEVYRFLESAAARCGLGFWKPGSGIIHQVILENYAFPGGFLVGADSHTPNAGGLGMVAVGVGGADAVDAMVGLPVSLRMPRQIGVHLTGSLSGWSSPKDVIIEVASRLTVQGGTGSILEYFGPGAESISATGKATICNMGAEVGATTSMFNFDDAMARYLRATGRDGVADLAEGFAAELRSDDAVAEDPERFYDKLIEIDLSTLEPRISGPGSPDRVRPLSQLPAEAVEQDYPLELSFAMIGSCTNSSYQDIGRTAAVARQAREAGLMTKTPLFVTPGSDSVRQTLERDGMLDDLVAIGATILANACGPCIGQWDRQDGLAGKRNSIITSFNRNFPRRNDGHSETLNFIGSPEVVVAASLAGRLDIDPTSESLGGIQLHPPIADELPERGWITAVRGFVAPPDDAGDVEVDVAPDSGRLAILEPFEAPRHSDYAQLRVLIKIAGKCTTDHISPAGPWLRLRGHLDKLSDNTLLGATNAYTGELGRIMDLDDGGQRAVHEVARRYQRDGIPWVVVGDMNYGEGSSREHAAMQIRYLGGFVVVTRSFARIHETNLKKQGVLPLVFDDPQDYDRIEATDRLAVPPPDEIRPGQTVLLHVTHADGSEETIRTSHTLNEEQLEWLRAGSAMNHIRHHGVPDGTGT